MKHFYSRIKKFLNIALFLGIFLQSYLGNAQTTLSPGDIVFTGYDATGATSSAANADTFSFIILANISANTVISFTDRGYTGSGWFTPPTTSTTEGTITWTSSAAIARGTEITIKGLSASTYSTVTSTSTANGSITYNSTESAIQYGLSLSSVGDQIIAFQGGAGSVTAGGVTLISGISYSRCNNDTSDNWDSSTTCSIGPSTSALPPTLVPGTSAFYTGVVSGTTIPISAKFDGTGAPFASVGAARTALMDQTKWTKTTTAQTLPTAYTYLGTVPVVTANPSSVTVCSGSNTAFSVSATGATSYQWQVDTGGGFANLSNGAPYSGVTTATLTITGATSAMNLYQYRCVVTGAGSVNSTAATLSVPTAISSSVQSQSNVSTYNGTNGSATITVSGGTAPYFYSWAPSGGTSATATNLSAGTYTVTITDSTPNGLGGCTATQNVTKST